MIDPTDFCPGCNSLRCTCEEDERAAIRENAKDAEKALESFIESMPELDRNDEANFQAAIDTIRQILSQFTQEYGD